MRRLPLDASGAAPQSNVAAAWIGRAAAWIGRNAARIGRAAGWGFHWVRAVPRRAQSQTTLALTNCPGSRLFTAPEGVGGGLCSIK